MSGLPRLKATPARASVHNKAKGPKKKKDILAIVQRYANEKS